MGKRRRNRKNRKVTWESLQGDELRIKIDYHRLKERCLQSIESFEKLPNAQVFAKTTQRTYLADKETKEYRTYQEELTHIFIDNGANILAVAHRDTVLGSKKFARTKDGRVICAELDDRLGCYIILDLLPRLGLTYDILLTEGEESGQSTAKDFEPPEGKKYNWIFEFDRRGHDVVFYGYHAKEWEKAFRDKGFNIGHGSFSDIAELESLGCKAVNIGCGYHSEHSMNCHMIPSQTIDQVKKFVAFYEQNKDTHFPHVEGTREYRTTYYRTRDYDYSYDDYWWNRSYRGTSTANRLAGSCPVCKRLDCNNWGYCGGTGSSSSRNLLWDYWSKIMGAAVCLICEQKESECDCGGLVMCLECETLVPFTDTISLICTDCWSQSTLRNFSETPLLLKSGYEFPDDNEIDEDIDDYFAERYGG